MRGPSVRGARRRDRQSCRSIAATRRRPIVRSKRNEVMAGSHVLGPPAGEKCGLGVCPTERKSPIFCPHLGPGITTDHNWLGWKFSVGQTPSSNTVALARSRPESACPEPFSREAARDRSLGWSEAQPWVKTPGGSPEGAEESTPHNSNDGANFHQTIQWTSETREASKIVQ
jgi:hypothetical protein